MTGSTTTSAMKGEMSVVSEIKKTRHAPRDGEVAVGEIDDAHHPKHKGKAAGEQRVIAAEQYAVEDLRDPDHALLARLCKPKYAS